jgi:hypothetical protein
MLNFIVIRSNFIAGAWKRVRCRIFSEKVFSIHISLPLSLYFNGSYHTSSLLYGKADFLGIDES